MLKLGMLEDVDFLKVGHHGSHYSTCQQFLDTVRPEYAVISCSSTNTYGHPSPEITKRLEETGCQTSFYYGERCCESLLGERGDKD